MGIGRDTVAGDDRYWASLCSGEVNSACPCAHAVDVTTVGAHLDGVPGSGSKTSEGVGVVTHSLDDCEVGIASLIGHIPCCLAATSRPTQLHLVGIGGTGSESRGSRAGDIGGEAHHTRPLASTVGTAVALHLGLVRGLGSKFIEGHRIGSGRSTLPIARSDNITDDYVVNMKIVITARSSVLDRHILCTCGNLLVEQLPNLSSLMVFSKRETGGSGISAGITHLERFRASIRFPIIELNHTIGETKFIIVDEVLLVSGSTAI